MDLLDAFDNPVPQKKEAKEGTEGMEDQEKQEGARYIPMEWYAFTVLILIGFFWMFPSKIVSGLYGYDNYLIPGWKTTMLDWILMVCHLLYLGFVIQYFRLRQNARSFLAWSIIGASVVVWINSTFLLAEGARGLEVAWSAIFFFGLALYVYVCYRTVEGKQLFH